jgi:hypothetical protein
MCSSLEAFLIASNPPFQKFDKKAFYFPKQDPENHLSGGTTSDADQGCILDPGSMGQKGSRSRTWIPG